MGVWDETTPAGSAALSQGDDRIRELKVALGEALSHEDSTFPGATPSSTPIFIPGFLRGATGSRPTGDSLVNGRLYLNTTLGVIERYNGSSWDTIFTLPANNSIDETKLTTSVAGSGLTGGNGTALAVNVGTGLEISSDAVRIAAAAAGDGLSGGAGSALAVNVDGSTIEINADTLRVKDAGITAAKLNVSGCGLTWSTGSNTQDPGASNGLTTFNPVVVSTVHDRGMTVSSNAFTVPTTGAYTFAGYATFNCDDVHDGTLLVRLSGSRTHVLLPTATAALDARIGFGGAVYLESGETYHIEIDADCTSGVHNPNGYKTSGALYLQLQVA